MYSGRGSTCESTTVASRIAKEVGRTSCLGSECQFPLLLVDVIFVSLNVIDCLFSLPVFISLLRIFLYFSRNYPPNLTQLSLFSFLSKRSTRYSSCNSLSKHSLATLFVELSLLCQRSVLVSPGQAGACGVACAQEVDGARTVIVFPAIGVALHHCIVLCAAVARRC